MKRKMLHPSVPKPELDELLKASVKHTMTPGELWDQRLSWAYGNVAMHNDRITKEAVRRCMEENYGPRPSE